MTLNALLETHGIVMDQRQREAVNELVDCIARQFPDAKFELGHWPDESAVVYVVAEVDLEDPDVVIDLVIDRVIDLQVEEEIMVGVMAVPTPERNAAIRAEQLRQQQERALATQVRA